MLEDSLLYMNVKQTRNQVSNETLFVYQIFFFILRYSLHEVGLLLHSYMDAVLLVVELSGDTQSPVK